MSEKNWKVRTSGSLQFVVYYEDASGNPVDISTGYSVNMDVKKSDDTSVAANLATITNGAGGEITATALDLTSWPIETVYYDLILTGPGGVKEPLLWGEIEVVKGVSTS